MTGARDDNNGNGYVQGEGGRGEGICGGGGSGDLRGRRRRRQGRGRRRRWRRRIVGGNDGGRQRRACGGGEKNGFCVFSILMSKKEAVCPDGRIVPAVFRVSGFYNVVFLITSSDVDPVGFFRGGIYFLFP